MARATKEELTEALVRQAALFGEERVEELRPGLQERAEHLWLLGQMPPDSDEEPAVIFIP